MNAKNPSSTSALPHCLAQSPSEGAKGAAHCAHRTPSGRRCRLPISDFDTGLCLNHALRHKKDRDLADLASALTGKSEEFQTAAGINRSLSELYTLLAQNRISPRRAAVLAYISNLLLRTLPAIEKENDPDADDVRIVWDIPRPNRPGPDQPDTPMSVVAPTTAAVE